MSRIFSEEELSLDKYLGGKLSLWQPKKGYRAGVDPVLLAATVSASSGDSVLELGCGAGALALCLNTRVTGLSLTGIEIHPGYAALARKNAQIAGADFKVHCSNLTVLPNEIKSRLFDHVVANPPYYDRETGTASQNLDRETALGESVSLSDWIETAAKRIKPKGYLHFVLNSDRLADALSAAREGLGSLEVLPIAARNGRSAKLVILRGRKDGRAKFKLHAPLVLHQGDHHPGDKEHYQPAVRRILRDGDALIF